MINIVLFIFNLHPDPAARRLAVAAPGGRARRTAWQLRPFVAQYGSILLLVFIFGVRPDARSDERLSRFINGITNAPAGRLRSASFGAHLRAARRARAERARSGGWLTPAQLALFDGMHVADRRHGLDVVAALRAAGGDDDPSCCSRACSTTAPRARTSGVLPRVAWSLGERYGTVGRGASPGRCPGFGGALDRLRDHAERRRCWPWRPAARPATAELIRHQAAPVDRSAGEAPAARRRGLLSGRDRPLALGPSRRAVVRAVEGRRGRGTPTHVRARGVRGTAGLLLSLIEQRQLDVLTVPLGDLAGAYLDALAAWRTTSWPTSARS